MKDCNCQTTIVHQERVNRINKQKLSDDTIKDMANFFKIFGDETRLKIINALLISKMCVCDIATVLNMSHSAVSHQLITLKKLRIVKYSKIGKMVYYELNDDHIENIFNKGKEHVNE